MYWVESAQAKQILAEDGYQEHDDVYMKVMNICLDDNYRRAFLDLTTKEDRLKWLQVS
jgi:hypothetical protein